MVLVCVALVVPAGFATALSPFYEVYILLQTLVACLLYGAYIGCFVIGEAPLARVYSLFSLFFIYLLLFLYLNYYYFFLGGHL